MLHKASRGLHNQMQVPAMTPIYHTRRWKAPIRGRWDHPLTASMQDYISASLHYNMISWDSARDMQLGRTLDPGIAAQAIAAAKLAMSSTGAQHVSQIAVTETRRFAGKDVQVRNAYFAFS